MRDVKLFDECVYPSSFHCQPTRVVGDFRILHSVNVHTEIRGKVRRAISSIVFNHEYSWGRGVEDHLHLFGTEV